MAGMTFFFGADNPLSNWHPAAFVVNRVAFGNNEQFMVYCKAKLFGDEEIAARILEAKTPREHKALGRQVRGFDEAQWNEKRELYVRKGCFAKFSQNPSMLASLLKTEGTELVEASPYDKIWGVGLSASDPRILDKANWLGLNLLGNCLMQVRGQLLGIQAAKEHGQGIEMKNNENTIAFFAAVEPQVKEAALANIAKHYGITKNEALAEVSDPDAEHLLDYVTGPERAGLHVLMQKYELTAAVEINVDKRDSNMLKIVIATDTGNASFGEGGKEDEIARILESAAELVARGLDGSVPLMDINGNKVGIVVNGDGSDFHAANDFESAEFLSLSMNTDNDAFKYDRDEECARIIKEAAGKVRNGDFDFKLRDVNGNSVGKVEEGTGINRQQNQGGAGNSKETVVQSSEASPNIGLQINTKNPFSRVWNVSGKTWLDARVPGPWAVDNSSSVWKIINTETGKDKVIGPVNSSGTNNFDRAMQEATRRNEELQQKLNKDSTPVQIIDDDHVVSRAGLYAELLAAGIAMDSHESDLYVPVTKESTAILAKYPTQKSNATTFNSAIDGVTNYDVPFAFAPFWEKKSAHAAERVAMDKASFSYVDTALKQKYEGNVLGVTDHHFVLSLGKTALIIHQGDIDRVPVSGEYMSVKFDGGKGVVEPVKAAVVER